MCVVDMYLNVKEDLHTTSNTVQIAYH